MTVGISIHMRKDVPWGGNDPVLIILLSLNNLVKNMKNLIVKMLKSTNHDQVYKYEHKRLLHQSQEPKRQTGGQIGLKYANLIDKQKAT